MTVFGRGAIHLVIACALVAPPAAGAQEPVQVDPDSPAGVEYQLPLDQARSDGAAGGGGGSGPGSGGGSGGPVPLFGAGIARDGSQSSGGGGEAAPDGGIRGGAGQSGDRADRGATGAGGGDGAGSGAVATGDGGGWTGLILGGIALAVVVLGGALGLALRRGLRTTPAS